METTEYKIRIDLELPGWTTSRETIINYICK